MQLIRTNSDHPLFLELVRLLNQELNERYGVLQGQYDEYNLFPIPVDVILLLENDQKAIACGALRRFEDSNWVEMKRVFVRSDYRGQGHSKPIILALEAWATEQGFDAIVLETGKRLHEAVSLYKRMNYAVIENFGPYIGMPLSICMKKDLNSKIK